MTDRMRAGAGRQLASYDVFVSDNEADVAFAERLASALRDDRSGAPLSVSFAPRALRPGADISPSWRRPWTTARSSSWS
jgi:hypothetical protein